MIIPDGKHKGREVCAIEDDRLTGLVHSWRNRNQQLSAACFEELVARHGLSVAKDILDAHVRKIETGEFSAKPYVPKPTKPFSTCAGCGRKCEHLLQTICVFCYGTASLIEDGEYHCVNVQRRLDSYFKCGLDLEIISEGQYRCLKTGIYVTANGKWRIGDRSGKGLSVLKKLITKARATLPTK
jgi:hypothetical protein